MMYSYTRSKLLTGVHIGSWNINNPDHLDIDGNQIYLSNEIEEALPGKLFTVHCSYEECNIIFPEDDLTQEEKTILDAIVNNHQNNV